MNIFFSYLTVFLSLLLLLLYPARKLAQQKSAGASGAWTAVHRLLHKTHSALGIVAIPIAFFHCRIAAEATDEKSILGGLLLILMILLALSYGARKPLGKHWITVHRVLAAAFLLLTVFHSVISIVA